MIETFKKIRLLAGDAHCNIEECDNGSALDCCLEIINLCADAEGLPVITEKSAALHLVRTGRHALQDAAETIA